MNPPELMIQVMFPSPKLGRYCKEKKAAEGCASQLRKGAGGAATFHIKKRGREGGRGRMPCPERLAMWQCSWAGSAAVPAGALGCLWPGHQDGAGGTVSGRFAQARSFLHRRTFFTGIHLLLISHSKQRQLDRHSSLKANPDAADKLPEYDRQQHLTLIKMKRIACRLSITIAEIKRHIRWN